MSVPDTYTFVREALGHDHVAEELEQADPGCTGGLAGELEEMSTAAVREITQLDADLHEAKAALEALWADASAVEYELVSVFIHGGTGTGGHYWTYQANLPRGE